MNYTEFLERKSQLGGNSGFEPLWMPDFLYDFQKSLVEWATLKGRAAIFADCGLGKTPMQLVWAENVCRKTAGRVLILTPLAVAAQTVREAEKFGIDCQQSRDGQVMPRITVANYERLHCFKPDDFAGVVCDESSILKHFSGATQMAVTRFMLKVQYRLLCTATAAPNDYIELGTSSETLGELSNSDMLTRFFRQLDDKGQKQLARNQEQDERVAKHFAKLSFRVSQNIGQWRLKYHAITPFWQWVCSWARACRKPSDLGFPDDGFILPPLREQHHIIMPKTPGDGMLFCLPAFGLREEREERRRTLTERCEFVADLVKHSDPAIIWCHMNCEGDLLEQIIPNSIQVSGDSSEEYKEAAVEWFKGDKCICNSPLFGSKLTAWRNQNGTSEITTTRTEASDLPSPVNTKGLTALKKRDICKSTDGSIPKNGSSQKQTSPGGRPCGRTDITQTQSSGSQLSKPQNAIGLNTQQEGQIKLSENTTRLSTPMKTRLGAKEGNVLFAESAKETVEDIGSTSTTVMLPINTGECSVPIVISDSENSATISRPLRGQSCICGHLSGNRKLISKSKIFGFGLNFQHCAHVVTFASHSYEQFYQSVRRCWRFGQKNEVRLDVVATEGERGVFENMMRKARRADEMFIELVKHMNDAQRVEHVKTDNTTMEKPSWL